MKPTQQLPSLFGIDTPHSPDFKFERRHGVCGLALGMCFRTPAIVLCKKELVEARPGDCFIHKPSSRLLHYAPKGADEGFRNDWFFVDGKRMARLMKIAGAAWDAPLRTGRPGIFEQLIKGFEQEASAHDEKSSAAIDCMILSTLISVARAVKAPAIPNGSRMAELMAVRETMRGNLTRQWTLAELARTLSLSPVRFAALYRERFKQSPIADLIDARISAACKTLAYSGLSVKEVAASCGFSDVHYFSRLFRRKTGLPPASYRERFYRQ